MLLFLNIKQWIQFSLNKGERRNPTAFIKLFSGAVVLQNFQSHNFPLHDFPFSRVILLAKRNTGWHRHSNKGISTICSFLLFCCCCCCCFARVDARTLYSVPFQLSKRALTAAMSILGHIEPLTTPSVWQYSTGNRHHELVSRVSYKKIMKKQSCIYMFRSKFFFPNYWDIYMIFSVYDKVSWILTVSSRDKLQLTTIIIIILIKNNINSNFDYWHYITPCKFFTPALDYSFLQESSW